MALKTSEEMLEITQLAIIKVLEGGQVVNAYGKSVTRANLAELRAQERYLKGEIIRDNSGGIRCRRAVPR